MNTQLQEIIERGRQAAEERKRQDELDAIARMEDEERKRQDRLRKSGLAEWMIEYLIAEFDRENWWYTLALPGCSPIIFKSFTYKNGASRYDEVGVRTPTELHYDHDADLWIVRYSYEHLPRLDNLDEAIALAASYGDAWHAMQAEAERRNAEGLRPEPPTPAQPDAPVQPDPLTRIAVALEIIAVATETIAERLDGFSDNSEANDALRVNVLR